VVVAHHPRILWASAGFLYSFLSILAKVFGCGIPAMFCNFNFRGGMRIGIGMLPHGEVALIIAGIGLASGILNQAAKIALSPESATAPHMQFMAMISNALDESGRDELLKCSTPKEMYQALTKS
jgi:Kef-type K+ transport system membrane component KefB